MDAVSSPSRRTVLRAALVVPVLPVLPVPATAAAPALDIRPRSAWAGGLPATGALAPETDVRFLLVHHTASSNDYSADGVAAQLRGFFRYHTSDDKGWPDIAYNFLVDRFGGVWEGRTGSVAGPVQASATGGSQGFAQLACFIGDVSSAPPTPAARTAVLALLAWLADRYGVDTTPGAEVTFTSRGSNRWPAGTSVRTATIAGHRDMSLTTCPGDGVYADVRGRFPAEVTALRAPASPPPATAAPTSEPPATPSASPSPRPSTTPSPTVSPPPAATRDPADDADDLPAAALAAGGLAAAAAAGAAAVLVRSRRSGG